MNKTQISEIIIFAHKEQKFVFNLVPYTNKQIAILLFIWLRARDGQFIKRADICQYFGFSYVRLLYKNGSLKKLIDNNLVHQIRNNQRFNGIFYISGLGNNVVDKYLLDCEIVK